MFYKTNNSNPGISLSAEDQIMLDRINSYAEKVLGDIDPQKTRISFQLDKLRPIMQEIADEKGAALEDIFIRYMDLASMVSASEDARLKADLGENDITDFTAF